jgi:hypothetical protein
LNERVFISGSGGVGKAREHRTDLLAILIASLVAGRHIGHVDSTPSRCGIRRAPPRRGLFISPIHTSCRQALSVHGFFKYSRDLLRKSAMLGGGAPPERIL